MKNSFLLTFCLWFLHSLNAQWEPMHGPYGGWIHDLEQNITYQFVSTGHGLYRSGDNGISWEQLKIGDFPISSSWSIGINREQLVVSVRVRFEDEHQSYLYRSDDNGNSWTMISRPDTAYFQSEIAINDYGIFLNWNYDLWVSTDEGLTWNYSSLDSVVNSFNGLTAYNGSIYVGSSNKLYKSSLTADEWEVIEVDDMNEGITTIDVFDSLIFIREYQYGKLYRSEDGGDTWTHSLDPDWGNGWTNFVKIDNIYYANHLGNIFQSGNNGKTWAPVEDKFEFIGSIYKMINVGDTILVGTLGEGMLRSSDYGLSFQVSNLGLGATIVNAIESDQNNLWTGCNYIGVSRYQKSPSLWDTIVLESQFDVSDIRVLDNRIFVTQNFGEIYRSDNNGTNWSSLDSINQIGDFHKLYVDGHSIMAGGISEWTTSELFISDDYGTTWRPDTFRIDNKLYRPFIFSRNTNNLFKADHAKVYRSGDNGLTWQNSSSGIYLDTCLCYIIDLFTFDEVIFVLISDQLNYSLRLFISRNNGDTWEHYKPNISEDNFEGFEFITHIENILLATGANPNYGGVYISFDNATTWEKFDDGLALVKVNDITFDEQFLYSATGGQGVWRRPIQDLYTLSNKEISSEEEFLIFPNPSDGNFQVKTESVSPGEARLLIHDVSGRILESRDIFFDKLLELNTNHLPPGLYILSLQTAEKVYSGKFVVQD